MSLREQGKELAGQIIQEDVPHLREAVSQAVTGANGTRRSGLSEIWATIKGIWDKIVGSGIIKAVIDKVTDFVQAAARTVRGGPGNLGGESAPLLPNAWTLLPTSSTTTVRSVLQDLPKTASDAVDSVKTKLASVAEVAQPDTNKSTDP